MYKFIDSGTAEDFDGFAYQGRFGIEYVTVLEEQVKITDSEGGDADISIVDIPKLILALQAAYDFKGN